MTQVSTTLASETDRLEFWAEQARALTWRREWDSVLQWDLPAARWFEGGRLNAAVNCLDRHVQAGLGDRVALYFEGEPGDSQQFTYSELTAQVCRAANLLTSLGVRAGDRVAIYLPMIAEAVVAMLACARLGAPHSVVFAGFSAQALHDRIVDADACVVITADGGFRRGSVNPLKPAVDEALAKGGHRVERVLVVRRAGNTVGWHDDRDLWWDEQLAQQPPTHEPADFDAEQPLFILHTSGTTGKPKGILHTTGGYLTQTAYTHRSVFDLQPARDVYWCTADIGWITGHSYVVYGPLANASSIVIYEGTPETPHQGRFWEIVAKYRVSILYTAPTAIRTFMKWGEQLPASHDLSSLRVLGSVGEPINPEAWSWYRRVIGQDRCPIVDTWWQTETGAIMVSPTAPASTTKAGSAGKPVTGVSVQVVDVDGDPVPPGEAGLLVIDRPWPAMLRGIWRDELRFRETYWDRFAERGFYFAGDGARVDADGDLWLLGRVDDVMNVSGHRISTAEVESALVSHPAVAEAAVVGAQDETTGQAIVAFVILRDGYSEISADTPSDGDGLIGALRDYVGSEIGPIAKPRRVLIVPELPKTRSGKIMRRLLRDLADGKSVGDTSTLADASVMELVGRSTGSDR